MTDWLDDLLNDRDAATAIAAHVARLRAGPRHDGRAIVAAAERAVRDDPAGAFTFDAAGHATLTVDGASIPAGRFATPTLADLSRKGVITDFPAAPKSVMSPFSRLLVLDGASPATDVGALQATCGEGTAFQVASQFNCLEAPSPRLADVADYFDDFTQGPRASIGAWPATLLRHYAAPSRDGASRFVQRTDGQQVELLADAVGVGGAPSGYFTGDGCADLDAAVDALEANGEAIRVGIHEGAGVLLGHDWHGAVDAGAPAIAQVFTSTVAGGHNGGKRTLGRPRFERASRALLRAAYRGTLLAAASLGKRRVVLTLIGGGVFANPVAFILDAIVDAYDAVAVPAGLDVVVNGFSLGEQCDLATDVLPRVRARGGAIARLGRDELLEVMR